MEFLGMGIGEIALILIIALIIFGPGRLPEIARTLGRMSRSLKRVSSEFTTAMTKELELEEQKSKHNHLSPDQVPKTASIPAAVPPAAETPTGPAPGREAKPSAGKSPSVSNPETASKAGT